MNVSTLGTFQRVFATTPNFQPIVNAPGIASAWIVVAGVIGFTTLFVVFADNTTSATDRAFALLLTAAQLVSPVGWVYYLWLAVGPVAAIAFPIDRGSLIPRSAIACCVTRDTFGRFLYADHGPLLLEPSVWATITLGSVGISGPRSRFGPVLLSALFARAAESINEMSNVYSRVMLGSILFRV